MGRGDTVYNFRCTIHCRALHDYSGCGGARSIFTLYLTHLRWDPETKKIGSAAVVLPTSLDSYRLCLSYVQEAFTIIQLSLFLVFGRYFFTLFPSPPFLNYPPDRSHRCRGFRSGRYTEQNHEIDEPRDSSVKHSRHRQQGRRDILRTHNHVSFPDLGCVPCGGGEVLCTGVRN